MGMYVVQLYVSSAYNSLVKTDLQIWRCLSLMAPSLSL